MFHSSFATYGEDYDLIGLFIDDDNLRILKRYKSGRFLDEKLTGSNALFSSSIAMQKFFVKHFGKLKAGVWSSTGFNLSSFDPKFNSVRDYGDYPGNYEIFRDHDIIYTLDGVISEKDIITWGASKLLIENGEIKRIVLIKPTHLFAYEVYKIMKQVAIVNESQNVKLDYSPYFFNFDRMEGTTMNEWEVTILPGESYISSEGEIVLNETSEPLAKDTYYGFLNHKVHREKIIDFGVASVFTDGVNYIYKEENSVFDNVKFGTLLDLLTNTIGKYHYGKVKPSIKLSTKYRKAIGI